MAEEQSYEVVDRTDDVEVLVENPLQPKAVEDTSGGAPHEVYRARAGSYRFNA